MPLRVKVLQFPSSNGACNLRDVCEGLDEKPEVVVHCLRRLWKKELILRTREPVYISLRTVKEVEQAFPVMSEQ